MPKAKTKAAPVSTSNGARRLRLPKRQPLKRSKRYTHPVTLPPAWRIMQRALAMLWQHKALIAGITFWYALISLILVQSLSSSGDVETVKSSLSQALHGESASVLAGLGTFGYLAASSGNTSSGVGGSFQFTLIIIVSLALIWAYRELLAGAKIRLRDAFYKGMTPLIPFVMVLLTIFLQLLPLLAAAALYNAVTTNGIAITGGERLLWGLGCIVVALPSFYWITSSIFAAYIVTLPGMTPLKALRSARQLVRLRRGKVLLKILFLPVSMFVIAAVIMLPIILWLTVLSSFIFFLLTMLGLAVFHAYMYSLYRELIRE